MTIEPWVAVVAFAAGGAGLGVGIVLGTYAVRALRRLGRHDDAG